MRTVVVFGLVMAALFAIGVAAATAVLGPPKDLFLPPPGDVPCGTRSPAPVAGMPVDGTDPRTPAGEV